jgi:hypothetical protein
MIERQENMANEFKEIPMTTLILKYITSIEDLLAFTEYCQRNSVSFQWNLRRQQFFYLGVCLTGGLLFVLLAFQDRSNPEVSILTGILAFLLYASPGILMFVLLPRLAYRSTRSQVTKAFAEGKNSAIFGKQELTTDNDTLAIRSDYHESRITWEAIEKIGTTPNYFFIHKCSIGCREYPNNPFLIEIGERLKEC